MLERFLSTGDANSAGRVLEKLMRHDIGGWVLTGGFATGFHVVIHGGEGRPRPLNDIDFVTESFGNPPDSLAHDYLFRHIHPLDPPGKTILQAIDPIDALRIDVFRTYGSVSERARRIQFLRGTLRLISIEDLVARTARLTLDWAGGVPVPAKHANDFLRLVRLVDIDTVEAVWREHGKPNHPVTFREANDLLAPLIPSRRSLLVEPKYSANVEDICQGCLSTSTFQLASISVVLSRLGYC